MVALLYAAALFDMLIVEFDLKVNCSAERAGGVLLVA
jgi:hypothetical protein